MVAHICVNETSYRKGHKYVTVVSDAKVGTVLYVGIGAVVSWTFAGTVGRNGECRYGHVAGLHPCPLACVPNAEHKIAFDRFHAEEQFSENFPAWARKETAQKLWNYVSRTWATKAWQQLGHEMPTYPHPKRGKNDQTAPLEYPECHHPECKQRPRRKHQQPHQNREGSLPWISE